MLDVLHAPLRALFDALLWPFRALPPLAGLAVVSLATGIGMLLVFKATSHQDRLDAVKRQIHAGLFEIRLYSDDLRAILRAQADILRSNVRYLGLTIVPMLWMIVPLFFLIAQLQFHYGYDGLRPGQATILTVRLAAGWESDRSLVREERSNRPALELEVPDGLEVDRPGVWVPALNEMSWRLRPAEPGDYEIGIRLGGVAVEKSVSASGGVRRRSPVKPGSFLEQLIYPAERPVPSGPFASVRIRYSDATISLFGVALHWLIWFFALTLVFAFALRRPLGVTI